MQPEALLAIRSDIASAIEPEYLAWLTREHTLERVAIDGFVSARIFRSRHAGFGRYLILYELANTEVVDSADYLDRLNNPTRWTIQMMPHLRNFFRGGGPITAEFGVGYGTAILTTPMETAIADDGLGALEAVSKAPGIVAVRVLESDETRTRAPTNERKLRSGDQSFRSLLMIEALDQMDLQKAAQELPPNIVGTEIAAGLFQASLYSQIFALNRGLLATPTSKLHKAD